MQQANYSVTHSTESVLATNKLIRNTYTLLSMTLLFSAVTATLSTLLVLPPMTYLLSAGGAIVLLWFVLPKFANSGAGVGIVFGITGLLGFGLGPLLNIYLSMPNGVQTVGLALGASAAAWTEWWLLRRMLRKRLGIRVRSGWARAVLTSGAAAIAGMALVRLIGLPSPLDLVVIVVIGAGIYGSGLWLQGVRSIPQLASSP